VYVNDNESAKSDTSPALQITSDQRHYIVYLIITRFKVVLLILMNL
jgi:hypothetical protein